MGDAARPGGKGPGGVPVHYFPKRAHAPLTTQTQTDVAVAPTVLHTLPEEADSGDHVTEPGATMAVIEERSKAKSKKKAASSKPRTTLEMEAQPALQYHQGKIHELLKDPDAREEPRTISRGELADVSVFGHRLFELGRYDEARVVFEGIVGQGVTDAFPHTMLGTIYLALGRQDRALALFEAALRLDPRDIAARVYRGEIRLNGGKVKSAVEDLQLALKVGPAEDPFVQRARRLLSIARDLPRRRKR